MGLNHSGFLGPGQGINFSSPPKRRFGLECNPLLPFSLGDGISFERPSGLGSCPVFLLSGGFDPLSRLCCGPLAGGAGGMALGGQKGYGGRAEKQ